ncbi:MAG: YqgE/AlgH family protein [Alphaproteobacteria bacterium]|nr:YqgE/AlgH family protein [Alphaproteobacteria bacterium]MBU0798245.1 YqgE/AlgH family protein [Alphaproteobacteria bacterium]MBU0888609.1 YqgE/AlgH family protein [Alphaproteobacteria bacterium]MBU1813657.1 YqgE/AlgH family protein [Alphaproteobacteria bacterium]MBU2091721.1 YqgE/AlgH family protein [Alphaproteobacteria bacterium]
MSERSLTDDDGYLTGQLLIAMPTMRDPRFARSVIYICAHSDEGAMGLVVNRLIGSLTFADLMEQLNLTEPQSDPEKKIHFGGPVETSRGFVLHTAEYKQDETMVVDGTIGLTATVDVLRDIAIGGGPRRSLLALGYSGWGPGQLETEIQDNGWLSVDADVALVFDDTDLDHKWDRAMAKIGVEPSMLSGEAGRA